MGEIVKDSMHGVMSEDEAWLRAIELSSLCCLPMAINTLIKLKVFDAMANADIEKEGIERGLYSADEIVNRMSSVLSDAKIRVSIALDRILRVVASHGVVHADIGHNPFTKHPMRTYGLNLVSQHFVHKEQEHSLAPLVLMNQDHVFMEPWQFLDEAVLDGGEPFAKAHNGLDAFAYGQLDPRFDSLFNSAMANHSALIICDLLKCCPTCFDDINVLVDVGGGLGSSLHLIISRFPHIRGINFDQPHVISRAPIYSGIEHVAGDMFIDIPQADAIFMKMILHDWSDECCKKILENCYKALPNNGKVIIIDTILPMGIERDLRARVGYHLDLLMFAYNPGGREHTQEDIEKLAKGVGFARLEVKSKINECSIIELYKL